MTLSGLILASKNVFYSFCFRSAVSAFVTATVVRIHPAKNATAIESSNAVAIVAVLPVAVLLHPDLYLGVLSRARWPTTAERYEPLYGRTGEARPSPVSGTRGASEMAPGPDPCQSDRQSVNRPDLPVVSTRDDQVPRLSIPQGQARLTR